MPLSLLGCAVISLHDLKPSVNTHWPCNTVSGALGWGGGNKGMGVWQAHAVV